MKSQGFKIAFCVLSLTVIATAMLVQSKIAFAPHRLNSARVAPSTPEEIAKELAEEAEHRHIMGGGEHYKPLRMLVEFPGVENPQMIDAKKSELPASTQIVGVDLDGEQFAFVLDAMRNPKHHIAKLVLAAKPICVAYCDRADCVRVLTDASKDRIPLKVGGLDVDNQMVFELRGKRFGQSSPGLPLIDVPFVRTTLGQWEELHPLTKLYLGPADRQADS